MRTNSSRLFLLLLTISFQVISLVAQGRANAASLQLTWNDNSQNEDGFQVERKLGTTGGFSFVAAVGSNITSYIDNGLADNATYCYRVAAFNSVGNSPYSDEVCGTTPATSDPLIPPTPSPTATVILSPAAGTTLTAGQAVTATGSGTNLSWDIDLIGDGLVSFKTGSGSSINFTVPTYANTSQFLRIILTGDAGSVTQDYAIVASPTPPAPQLFGLSVAKAGAGSGTVTSAPTGINCGTDCSESYNSGTLVTLTAIPAADSTFAGWSGTGCTNGAVTMDANKSCTASFVPQQFTLNVSVVKTITSSGTGDGAVTSVPAGINCGTDCSEPYNSGTVVNLTAVPAAGSSFAGWSGTGCTNGAVTMNANRTCTATFNRTLQKFTLSVNIVKAVTNSGTGNGTVTSSPAGINCGSTCSAAYDNGTLVTLIDHTRSWVHLHRLERHGLHQWRRYYEYQYRLHRNLSNGS